MSNEPNSDARDERAAELELEAHVGAGGGVALAAIAVYAVVWLLWKLPLN